MRSLVISGMAGAFALSVTLPALAQNDLSIVETKLDRPTVISLGVQVLVSGDTNCDSTISMRYRPSGASAWQVGLPLFHVRPSVVNGMTVPEQFGGSVFELVPATSYEIELHAQDPDGLDQTWTVTSTTRPVPADPPIPNVVNVSDASSLSSALNAAKAGDVITLADGTYSGQFTIQASGTAQNPIVIRGTSMDGVVLDGGGCTGCNIVEVYGSFVHVERLTLQNASRALRFQGTGAEGNVVRRVHFKDVTLGIGSKPDQKDFYICDNTLEGRLSWPSVYADDSGAHANDDGINLAGDGHVVCHNLLKGFGDAIKIEQAGVRSFDVYGNESLSAYDNALELDEMQGNGRAFRNRFLNSWSPLSFQPIYGGPAYAFRNIVVNVVDEQQKLHSLGGNETVGALLYNNTFVSPKHAANLQDNTTAHDFQLQNNIYFGPAAPDSGKTVDWSGGIDNATIDYNGWFPDGAFDFGAAGKWSSFSAMQSAGTFGAHGVLLGSGTFESGLAAPTSYTTEVSAPDVTLAAGSAAIDKGLELPGVTDGFQGSAPDLGALERGCPVPIYGVRPEGTDETNEPRGCTSAGTAGSSGTGGGGGVAGSGSGGVNPGGSGGASSGGSGASATGGQSASGGGDDGGCGCRTSPTPATPAGVGLLLALGALALGRRRQ